MTADHAAKLAAVLKRDADYGLYDVQTLATARKLFEFVASHVMARPMRVELLEAPR